MVKQFPYTRPSPGSARWSGISFYSHLPRSNSPPDVMQFLHQPRLNTPTNLLGIYWISEHFFYVSAEGLNEGVPRRSERRLHPQLDFINTHEPTIGRQATTRHEVAQREP